MKSKNKKLLTGAAALGLIGAVAAGGTLAYLTDQTESRANNFTFASINAMLTEPGWDGVMDYEYDDDGNITPVYDYIDDDVPVYGYEDGDKSKPVTDKKDITDTTDRPRKDSTDPDYKTPTYGDEQAQNMIPGASASKNPIITNTGSKVDEWVAAKITFVYAEGAKKAGEPLSQLDLQAVMDVIDIDYNVGSAADDWKRVEGSETSLSQVFYYQSILEKDANAEDKGVYDGVTEPIFTKVTVDPKATNEQLKVLEDMGGFAIWIEGFAVESTIAKDYDAFEQWGTDGNVTFGSTPAEGAPVKVTRPGIVPAE